MYVVPSAIGYLQPLGVSWVTSDNLYCFGSLLENLTNSPKEGCLNLVLWFLLKSLWLGRIVRYYQRRWKISFKLSMYIYTMTYMYYRYFRYRVNTMIVSGLGLLLLWWNSITQSNLGRKGFIWLTLLFYCLSLKEDRTEQIQTEQEPGAEATEGQAAAAYGLLFRACSTCFLKEPRTPVPGRHHRNDLSPPTSTTN